ncbi:MAG: glycosyltransferase family 39 protein [Candidatus Hodarchaeota archaeon]
MLNCKSQKQDIAFLLIIVFTAYILSIHPANEQDSLRNENSRSQYLITKAFAESGTFRIDPYINDSIPWDSDVAYYDGHYYSTKPPGVSFLAIPFYMGGKVVNENFLHFSGSEKEILLSGCVLIVSPLIVAVGIVALYGICFELGATRRIARLISIVCAFGTPLWVYAPTFFRHAPTAAFLLIGFYWGMRASRTGQKKDFILCGISLGYLVLSEYGTLLLAIPAIIYFSSSRFREFSSQKLTLRSILIFVGLLPPVLMLLIYNWMNFGSPARFSYSYSVYDTQKFGAGPEELLLQRTIIEHFQHALFMTFFPAQNWEDRAVFLLTPVLVFSLFEILRSIRMREYLARDNLFFLVCFLLMLALYSRWEEWWGGSDNFGSRQLLMVLPLLLLPLVSYLQKPKRPLEWLLFCASIAFGVFTAFLGAVAPWGSRTRQSQIFQGKFYLRIWFFPWFAPIIIILLVGIAFYWVLSLWKVNLIQEKSSLGG